MNSRRGYPPPRRKDRRKSKRKGRVANTGPEVAIDPRSHSLTTDASMFEGMDKATLAKLRAAVERRGVPFDDDTNLGWTFYRDVNGTVLSRPNDQRIADAMMEVLGIDAFVAADPESSMSLVDQHGNALHWKDLPPAPRHKPGEMAVQHYLTVCQKLLESSQANATRDLTGKNNHPEALRLARLAWAHARNARVFEFSAELRRQLIDDEIDHLLAEVRPLHDQSNGEPTDASRELFDQLCRRFHYPDPRPFEHCFFGFDREVWLPEDAWLGRITPEAHNLTERVMLLGYLIGPDTIWEMLYVSLNPQRLKTRTKTITLADRFIVPNTVWDEGRWLNTGTLNPFLVTALNEEVLTHQSVVEHRPGLNQRMSYKKVRKAVGKGHGLIPRPYYVVPVRDRTIKERERADESGKGRQLAYRHDREGHYRLYVRRGPLPLPDKDREGFVRRGFTVFTAKPPGDIELLKDMMKKGHAPKRRGEWLAVKRTWIDDQVVGDPSLPYIPAVRVPEEDLKKRRTG